MNITVSNIERVFLTDSNIRGELKVFLKALETNEISYDLHNDGNIEVLFFNSPLIENSNERLENVLKKHVKGFSDIVWKTSLLNCEISNIKTIFIRNLKENLTMPVAKFKKELENSSLDSSYGPNVISLRFKKPNFTYDVEKYTSDFENVLKHVKAIAEINWQ